MNTKNKKCIQTTPKVFNIRNGEEKLKNELNSLSLLYAIYLIWKELLELRI